MRKRKFASKLPVLSMVGSVSAWVLLLIFIPMVYILVMSFLTRGTYGGVVFQFSADGYKTLFDMKYLEVVLKSIGISLRTTIICILIGYPFAFYIARRPAKKAAMLILLLMVPFWTSGLVKTYSWVLLLNASGIVNRALMAMNIVSSPVQFLYNDYAVTLGLVYGFLPYAVLPMYSSIEKLDRSLLEASNDLGAKPVRSFFKVTLPLTAPGIFASVILVFIPSLGAYFTADALGGGTSLLVGNLIRNLFSVSKNWPFGAAVSVLLVLFTLILLFLYSRVGDMDDLV